MSLYDAGGRWAWKTDSKRQGVEHHKPSGSQLCPSLPRTQNRRCWKLLTLHSEVQHEAPWQVVQEISLPSRHCFCRSALALWWLNRAGGTLTHYPAKGYSCSKEMEGLSQIFGRKIQSPEQAHKISQSKMPSINVQIATTQSPRGRLVSWIRQMNITAECCCDYVMLSKLLRKYK